MINNRFVITVKKVNSKNYEYTLFDRKRNTNTKCGFFSSEQEAMEEAERHTVRRLADTEDKYL